MTNLLENYSLKHLNTFGIDTKAKFFCEVSTIDEIRELAAEPKFAEIPKLILGGGSNLLFVNDFEGLVFQSKITGIEILEEDDAFVTVRVGAGENWDNFVNHCVTKKWGGIENLSDIPGTVGASPIQNIGAYGVEVKDVIENVEVINLKTLETKLFSAAECHFDYRDSIFKRSENKHLFITSVTFRLTKFNAFFIGYKDLSEELKKYKDITLQTVRHAILAIRKRKLPDYKELGNAGSFFKNPVISLEKVEELKQKYEQFPLFPVSDSSSKIAAAWLIDQCGWKGKRIENVGVHENQALVIVNYGNATGKEVLNLANQIIDSVSEKFGILLEKEVNII